jgi:SAM-dependent methyltransferase
MARVREGGGLEVTFDSTGDVPRACWCGNTALEPFSPHYLLCRQCDTLVSLYRHDRDVRRIVDEDSDLYGREYWFAHMTDDLGFVDLYGRARNDMVERCPFWLRAALKYTAPPGRALELGSAHGGFVATLGWAGFQATGLELSPAIATIARELFGVEMLEGPIEDQRLDAGTFALIAMMDVLEHLPDPVETLRCCRRLLTPEGSLLIQTPKFPAGLSFADLERTNHRFLELLKEQEHLYLFSERSVRQLLETVGCPHVAFEPPLFAHYDMFLAAGPAPLRARTPADAVEVLARTPTGRLLQGLLDATAKLGETDAMFQRADADREERLATVERLHAQLVQTRDDSEARLDALSRVSRQLEASESDRAARLEMIEYLDRRLREADRDRAERLDAIHTLDERLAAAEADRSARLEAVNALEARLVAAEIDRTARFEAVQRLEALLAESEADRAARLDAMNRLTAMLKESEADRAARLELIEALRAQLAGVGARSSV